MTVPREKSWRVCIVDLAKAGEFAQSVGCVVQIHRGDSRFRSGEEKSVFKFGVSAVVLLGQAEKWRPEDDNARAREWRRTFSSAKSPPIDCLDANPARKCKVDQQRPRGSIPSGTCGFGRLTC